MKFWPCPAPRCSIHATVGCPSHPLACWPLSSRIVPSLTEASRRPAAPTDHCQGCCAATMPAPSTQRQGLVQCLCFPLPCWHHVLVSSRSPPSCLGARRHHALAHPCVPRGHDQHPPYPAHHVMPTYGQSPPRVPFTVPIATVPLRRASAHPPNRFATALSRHLPLPPPPVVSHPCQRLLFVFGKPPPPRLASVSATQTVPSHLTPPPTPCTGTPASLSFGAASQNKKVTPSPQLSSGAVVYAGELHISVAHLPHYELVLPTILGKCAVNWGSLRCTSCQGLDASESP
jgi:hypothetical protein